MDVKKAQKGLIDKHGRRKYFRELNPVLLKDPFSLDKSKITKKPRILFIMPNFHWIDEDVNALWDLLPWNLCQIAAMVEDVCEEVKIVDAYKYNLSKDDLHKEIKDFKPDIVGLTILMDQYAEAANMTTEIIKNVSQNITTVLGGVYAMANPRAKEDKNLDYVVIGEGEYVFRQLVGYHCKAVNYPTEA